jgi:hypothetical protein
MGGADGTCDEEGGISMQTLNAKQNLLVELFVEELPPKALKKMGDAFANTLAASLQSQGSNAGMRTATVGGGHDFHHPRYLKMPWPLAGDHLGKQALELLPDHRRSTRRQRASRADPVEDRDAPALIHDQAGPLQACRRPR